MEIYTYALGGNTFALANYPFTRCPYDTEQHFATKPKDVALLSVCRQIYSETRLVPFKENTFYALGIYQLLMKLKGFKFKSFQIAAFQRIRLSCDMRMYTGIERFLETVTGQREEEIMYFSVCSLACGTCISTHRSAGAGGALRLIYFQETTKKCIGKT
jgi:hypothetical protein